MAEHVIRDLQLLCQVCQRRVTCRGGMLGDPFWRVFCEHCEIVTLFPLSRYTTPADVVKTWAAFHAQGDLLTRRER